MYGNERERSLEFLITVCMPSFSPVMLRPSMHLPTLIQCISDWLMTFSTSLCWSSQTVDLDLPNTTESYKLYSQVGDLQRIFPSHLSNVCYFYSMFFPFFLSQRVIASDIKECVCRAPDTPYDGLYSTASWSIILSLTFLICVLYPFVWLLFQCFIILGE